MLPRQLWITVLVLLAILSGGFAAWAEEAAEGVVNINTADVEQLSLLPRVGETVAKRIVEFREKNGRFKTTEDLMLVRGIGETTFELLEPYVTLTGETTLEEKVRGSNKSSKSEKEGG